jgi:hypothetical protein
VRIGSTRSKALKRLIEDDEDREIRRDLVNRVRRIVTALISAPNLGRGRQAGAFAS